MELFVNLDISFEKLANSIKKPIRNSYRLKQMTQEVIDIILCGIEKSFK